MSVKSPTVTITVEKKKKYTLDIDVSPKSGFMGDTFVFSGLLLINGSPVSGQVIDLNLKGVGKVKSGSTGVDGDYLISWKSDRVGKLNFHAKAPYVGILSPEIQIQIPSLLPLVPVLAPILIGSVLLAVSR